ncbi:uncharacterized protein GIQ15_02590 [Arthroderma uncinatum]|uniref:uncharacterized protein n=1 Tax=Arthroderma uncinatum TaxID=74035 RepID=UPI00144A715C|nr:uncharacterized protein GIQ15_02590 [Arthroderma uncinatum]KAF3483266.1 hypothetical protein GIQ15_02590 [Arthroderma uncinatum]
MHISNSLLTFALYVASIHQSLAAPVNLDENATSNLAIRADPGENKKHAIQATMKVSGEGSLAFDADCYAILCLDVDPVFERTNSKHIKNNRKDSGVTKTYPKVKGTGPFRNPTLSDTSIPGAEFVSPEEFPFASTKQGGKDAYLFPVSKAAQDSQGASIKNFYTENNIEDPDVGKQNWYEIVDWTGTLGPYCQALHDNGGKSDKHNAICKSGGGGSGSWGFDVADYAYQYNGDKFKKVDKA